MNVVAYVLVNAVGEQLVIPARLEEVVARELQADGWVVYRAVRG